ncbi:formamidopyrimidine-DNA glycosylase [Tupanvirus soda lake]|uniref:Formamidopyrimidine-DNA glycosylase n=2 Tax=Tupanvirus TaxID=2094720 RepID=A0A6N1NUZ2_9VIRU|nr:formamidopyrimidine-DNA glycosylase [Tupanvirus soda lake]QKU35288.1 formamidopyrimidine-DNA glycosylase [Tupanvirus soda lake]
MVEAPRIRILYEKIKHTKNKKIIRASGASYKKININLEGYTIRKWWFAGKYMYTHVIKNDFPEYVIRTHMMMYGKIIINNEREVNPKLIPFLILELDDGTILTWYLTQIKILDPNCTDDQLKSNYNVCSSRKNVIDSIKMMKYDVSNAAYNKTLHMKHLLKSQQKHPDDIVTDFLLNQAYFPGVGNILQQEVLYRCKTLPTKKLLEIDKKIIMCFVDELKVLLDQLYQSYKRKLHGLPHEPILQVYHKGYCPLGHKTVTKIMGYHKRRTTWCPVCQI